MLVPEILALSAVDNSPLRLVLLVLLIVAVLLLLTGGILAILALRSQRTSIALDQMKDKQD